MFKTHESAYYNLAPVYGPDHHHWKLVEREIATPWLHATVIDATQEMLGWDVIFQVERVEQAMLSSR